MNDIEKIDDLSDKLQKYLPVKGSKLTTGEHNEIICSIGNNHRNIGSGSYKNATWKLDLEFTKNKNKYTFAGAIVTVGYIDPMNKKLITEAQGRINCNKPLLHHIEDVYQEARTKHKTKTSNISVESLYEPNIKIDNRSRQRVRRVFCS